MYNLSFSDSASVRCADRHGFFGSDPILRGIILKVDLREHPQEAAELRRIMNTPLPGPVVSEKNLQEMESLRNARQHIRRWSRLVGAAIYFSLLPFSFVFHKDGHYRFFRESPTSAIIYGAIGVGFWVAYLVKHSRSRIL